MTETPEQIAARYGAHCPPGMTVTVCPPCTYSEGFWSPGTWKQQATAQKLARARQRGMQRARTGAVRGAAALAVVDEAVWEQRRKAIVSAMAEGLNDVQMAEKLNVSDRTIAAWRQKFGIKLHVNHEEARAAREKIAPDVRRLAGEGLSDPEIARRLGVLTKSVWRVRYREGIPAGRPK